MFFYQQPHNTSGYFECSLKIQCIKRNSDMSARFIIFDTETSGLPAMKGYGLWPPATDSAAWSRARLLELAWVALDQDLVEVSRASFLIKPAAGVRIEEHGGMAINGLSRKLLESDGIELRDALTCFLNALESNPTLVAHNIGFDIGVMASEMHRLGMDGNRLYALPQFCTMEFGKPITALYRGPYLKNPKLSELCAYFGVSHRDAHRAMGDVEACLGCFLKMHTKAVV